MEQAKRIIDRALAEGKKTLSEHESKELLAAYGVPVSREKMVGDLMEAQAAAKELGFPVVLKVCGSSVIHKTELGLIQVGLKDPNELEQAFNRLQPAAQEAGAGLLLQEMVEGDRELVLGLTRDPGFGPCVMLGLGGIFAEALADVTFRITPLSRHDALEMQGELKSQKLLGTFRGKPEVDGEVLARCLTALGQLAKDFPQVKEVDVNPMIVRGGKPIAVDSLVVLAAEAASPDQGESARGGLEKFFAPRSVAVIGASATPHKPGNDVIKNILANQYEGQIYLVNPKGGEILGLPVYESIAGLPSGIDQAIIILPAKANPQAIRDCAAQGIKAIVLAAGGFAEVDEAGELLQEETVQAIQETGVRVIGPNTSGHSSTPAKFTSSFFPLGKLPRGNISYIAQTGNFATHTMRYIMSGENYGVARVVGMGNKLDVEESELLEYFAEDPETKAIFMYLESLKRPRRFLEVAARVTRQKPVVLLKGGASQEGARAAVAHTAALASDDRIIDGALKQAGVVRIYKYSQLFLVAKALAAMPLPKGNRVSFSAPSGAMLVSMTDLCRGQLGLEVPQLEEENRQRLQEISPPYIRMRNPVDIWPLAAVSGVEFAYREGSEAALRDPHIDAVVPIIMLTDETGVPSLAFFVELAQKYPEKPLYVTFSGQRKHMDAAKAFLEPRGVPTFPLIEEPFEVLSILVRCRRALDRPLN
jgi:acyl-CoA synthetase (NDP forming)